MYQVKYLQKGSKVFIHTGLFGKNQLIAGKVLCTYVEMKPRHYNTTFINTSLGVVRIYNDGISNHIFERLGADPDLKSAKQRCRIFSSVEDFRAGNEVKFLVCEAPIDLYGLVYYDYTKNPYGDFQVAAFYIKENRVEEQKIHVWSMMLDERNNRLVPASSLFQIDKHDDIVGEITTPYTKRDIIDMMQKSYTGVKERYDTFAEAKKALEDSVEIIDLDGEILREEPPQPTIKDKLQEFVEQQGTSLEMLRSIINEMP